MKCPKCTVDIKGAPVQDIAARPEMTTGLRAQDGKFYSKCSGCGHQIEEEGEKEALHPHTVELGKLKDAHADLTAKATRLELELKATKAELDKATPPDMKPEELPIQEPVGGVKIIPAAPVTPAEVSPAK